MTNGTDNDAFVEELLSMGSDGHASGLFSAQVDPFVDDLIAVPDDIVFDQQVDPREDPTMPARALPGQSQEAAERQRRFSEEISKDQPDARRQVGQILEGRIEQERQRQLAEEAKDRAAQHIG